ncbi:glycosyltransferase family 4 protein [Halobellus rarus]|uniref:Glycosyltransferase family 4 protein n=1 Tax=Halobellus rarus TaxID=1126237 RepID=A0ABD6CKL3_9EURY|nr:glycosyltransferase family 4 protein [Halobellus rarus]
MNLLQLSRVAPHPPQNGAEVRVWKTSEKLSEQGDLWLATPPGDEPIPGDITQISLDSMLFERRPLWNELWTASFVVSKRHPLRTLLTRAAVSAVDDHDVAFDVVVCEFPQLTDAAIRLANEHDAWLLLNKHNADYRILDGFLRERSVPKPIRRRAVENFLSLERRGIAHADAVVFQSQDDADRFEDAPAESTFVVPNGCDFESIRAGGDSEALRRAWDIDPEAFVCVFLGSYDYSPNRRAAEAITDEIAPALPDVEFVLIGRNPPTTDGENVHAPGYVDDLAGALEMADVALCPLFSGSGTKLKLLDYFAAGLPVVTTPVGVEGLPVEDGKDALVSETVEGIIADVDRLRASDDLRAELSEAGRDIAADHSWESLMAEYDEILDGVDQ